GPSPSEAPDSSLAHMCGLFAGSVGPAGPGVETWFVREGTLDVVGLRRRLAALPRGRGLVVLATSFALVHLLDALGGERLPLPEGSRVMQTGGYKGRSREVAPAELRGAVARTFAVDERAVVGEYGMTELSSQFWEATAASAGARPGVYVEPPWARVVPVDPVTLAPVPEGEAGIARIEDLANVDSAMAIVAQDRVRRVPGGFELLGRAPGAPPRGCSIAVDEMLGGTGTVS
ncbi:MAG TPA: acyl-protein synthetase, partial [Polyangiaceae bacterium]